MDKTLFALMLAVGLLAFAGDARAQPYAFDDPDAAYAEALRRIEVAREREALALNLSGIGLEALPPEIGSLAQLQVLYAHHNALTKLTPEIGNLTELKELYLGANNISWLPSEIGYLVNLHTMYLNENQFMLLPPKLEMLNNLEHLSFEDNPLGCVDIDVRVSTDWREIVASRPWCTAPPYRAGVGSVMTGFGVLVGLFGALWVAGIRRAKKRLPGLNRT